MCSCKYKLSWISELWVNTKFPEQCEWLKFTFLLKIYAMNLCFEKWEDRDKINVSRKVLWSKKSPFLSMFVCWKATNNNSVFLRFDLCCNKYSRLRMNECFLKSRQFRKKNCKYNIQLLIWCHLNFSIAKKSGWQSLQFI